MTRFSATRALRQGAAAASRTLSLGSLLATACWLAAPGCAAGDSGNPDPDSLGNPPAMGGNLGTAGLGNAPGNLAGAASGAGQGNGGGGGTNPGSAGGAGNAGQSASAGAAGMASAGGPNVPTDPIIDPPSFDRLANCTGGPYGNPLPQMLVTATAVPGSETDGAAGFQIFEGPVWYQGALYFSHVFADVANLFPSSVRRLTAANILEPFIANSGSNGLAIGIDGSLLAATHDTQSISRFDFATQMRSSVVSTIDGLPFNSPNDLVVRSDGTLYFTDPNWQNAGRASVGTLQLYRVATDNTVTAVSTPFQPGGEGGPNGIALSLDETILYVGGNGAPAGGQIAAYPVDAQGNLGAPTAFPPGATSVPDSDGMTLDCAGNLYVPQNDAITVYAPDGTILGTIAPAAGGATNTAFGGPDGATLYITSRGQGIAQLSSVTLNVPGLPY